MKKIELIGLALGIAISFSGCIGSMEDRPKNDIEAFYKCKLNASKGSCEKDNPLWLLGIQNSNSSSPTGFSIGGNITGLTTNGLVLQNNSTDDLTVTSGATSFTFTTKVSGDYSVSVKTQPTDLTCTVSNGSGTASDNVSNVSISCSATTFVSTPFTGATGLAGADTKSIAIAKDSDNNLYVTGYTTGNLDGETKIGTRSLFVIKFNRSGEKQWTKLFGHTTHEGDGDMQGEDIVIDSSNSIYVVGYSNEGLDGLNPRNQAILLKLDSNGNQVWKKNSGTGTNFHTRGFGLTLDSSENIYITGDTRGNLDGETLNGTTNLFLVKYNSNGDRQWTKLRGNAITSGAKIATDNSDNLYIVGETTGTFDGITKTAQQTIILLKFNSNGDWQWTRNNGQDSLNWGNASRGVKVDSSGNVFISGDATNDGIQRYRIMVAKYNSDGVVQKTEIIQTTADDNQNRISNGSNLALDSSGNLFLAGTISGSLNAEVVGPGHYVLQLDSELENAKYKIIKNEANRETYGVVLDGDNNVWTIVNSNDGFDGEAKIGGDTKYDMFLTNKLKP